MVRASSSTHLQKQPLLNSIQTTHRTRPQSNNTPPKQVQTPQQRRANEAYAKSEAAKRGKPQTEVERIMEKKKASKAGAQKSPVSKVWLCKFHVPWGMDLGVRGTYWGFITTGMNSMHGMLADNYDL